jgi:hypothetical protein
MPEHLIDIIVLAGCVIGVVILGYLLYRYFQAVREEEIED